MTLYDQPAMNWSFFVNLQLQQAITEESEEQAVDEDASVGERRKARNRRRKQRAKEQKARQKQGQGEAPVSEDAQVRVCLVWRPVGGQCGSGSSSSAWAMARVRLLIHRLWCRRRLCQRVSRLRRWSLTMVVRLLWRQMRRLRGIRMCLSLRRCALDLLIALCMAFEEQVHHWAA